ncbi:MAG: ribosome biogenesis GTPase Der [Bacteroidetes bacterium]|nr:ribosome biogenesis GTPase Der [Bacteroidota bacterium]
MMSSIIAIIGRPNVGKSTFFNRLVEKRKAITENEPGITRDRQYGTCEWNGKNFTIIDTGGYVNNSADIFEKEIKSQIHIAIKEADVILFMVDSKVGLTGHEQDIADILRKNKKPIFLISNKSDNYNYDLYSNDFYKLGLGNVYPISSISGYGTGELLDEVVKVLPSQSENEENENYPKISILGRPNVGKSSFLNVLLGNDRTIVTPIAGTTRDSINSFYNLFGKNFIITDTAGIRKKAKVNENIEFYSVMRSLKALQESDVCIILVDAQQSLESQDLNIISYAQKNKKGILLLINKWDLIEKDHTTIKEFKKLILDKLAPATYIPIIFVSVLNKLRIHKAVNKALDIYSERNKRISTSELNSVMLEIINKYPPPSNKGKYIKIKYITQLPTKTPTFAFFSNFPQYIKQPYKNYLENQLRKHFGFEGVPISLVFRKK